MYKIGVGRKDGSRVDLADVVKDRELVMSVILSSLQEGLPIGSDGALIIFELDGNGNIAIAGMS